MNQILEVTDNKKYKKNIIKKSKIFKIQLIFSILPIFIFLIFYINHQIKLKNELKSSKILSNNYEIYKLYSKQSIDDFSDKTSIIGTINIPKINITYPFFSGISDELLKISPCRFYGQMPNKKGNLCIAGHNYNDDRFFSKINLLKNGDEIFIENNYKQNFKYIVYNKFEVEENDLSPIKNYDKNNYTLTLITCNNKNKKRIIIKAKQKA